MKQENSLLRNTIALYFRMLFSVCVNIYISRIILDILGVEDFGIYTVVGGVVVFLGFINSSMAGSTSRFLSVAIGIIDNRKLKETYNAAKQLHLGVAILVLLIGETIGLWFVNGYLEMPEERVLAANVVYQLSLMTILFTIIQVPFSALIISMERMDVYAKIEISNVLMKLMVVLFLPYCMYDRLLLYSFLLFLIAFIVYFIYKFYCKRNFHHLKYENTIHLNIIRPMLSYSGWDMLGWGGVSLSTQGRQIFINKFFGVSLNAANGLAATASGAIQAFTNNVIMAFRPRIMKCYASHNYVEMQRLIELALIGTFILMSLIFVPMVLCMDYLLALWLVEIPPFTIEFCKLMLILQFLEAINTVVKIGIQASGLLKKFTISGFLIHMLNLIITFVLYKIGMSSISTYIIAIVLCFVNIGINIYILKNLIPCISCWSILINMIKGITICLGGLVCSSFVFTIVEANNLFSFLLILATNFFAISLLFMMFYYSLLRMFYR